MSSYEVKIFEIVICRIKCGILFKRIPLIPYTNKLSPPYVDGESDYFIPDTETHIYISTFNFQPKVGIFKISICRVRMSYII